MAVSKNHLPKAVKPERVLCHNYVRREPRTRSSVDGFRFWTASAPPDGFVPCGCGWSGLPHYAHADHAALFPSPK